MLPPRLKPSERPHRRRPRHGLPAPPGRTEASWPLPSPHRRRSSDDLALLEPLLPTLPTLPPRLKPSERPHRRRRRHGLLAPLCRTEASWPLPSPHRRRPSHDPALPKARRSNPAATFTRPNKRGVTEVTFSSQAAARAALPLRPRPTARHSQLRPRLNPPSWPLAEFCPPPEFIKHWESRYKEVGHKPDAVLQHVAEQASQWGADKELDYGIYLMTWNYL